MITTDDEDVALELRSLVNQGRSDNGDWLVHQRVGFNYRMDEMSAAIGIAQLEKLDTLLEARRRVAERYDEAAGRDRRRRAARTAAPRSEAGSSTTCGSPPGSIATPSQAAWPPAGSRRGPTCRRSTSSRPYRDRFGFAEGMLPVTERVSRSTLALPFYVQLEDDDVAHVAASLREVLQEL